MDIRSIFEFRSRDPFWNNAFNGGLLILIAGIPLLFFGTIGLAVIVFGGFIMLISLIKKLGLI